ncbi:MAG: helix-turn-helix transcriptional regulator [Thermotogota bacterium]
MTVGANRRRNARVSPGTAPQRKRLHPLLALVREMVPDLQRAIGPNCEVVLRDLQSAGNPIAAIAGDITHRQVGDPPTGLMQQWLESGNTNEDHLNYSGRTSDGKPLRASTLFLRDETGDLIGCICINIDISHVLEIEKWSSSYCDTKGIILFGGDPALPHGIDDTAEDIKTVILRTIDGAVAQIGKRPEAMTKSDRLHLVRSLDVMGVFALRNAKEYVAAALGVSKAAVYNYLHETRRENVSVRR